MPHLSIQYSRNLEERLDMPGLLRVLRDAAVETGVFPPAGIRVRAFAADHVLIADGDPKHGFIDIGIRLRGGRSPEDKARATAHIFAAAEASSDHQKALAVYRSALTVLRSSINAGR